MQLFQFFIVLGSLIMLMMLLWFMLRPKKIEISCDYYECPRCRTIASGKYCSTCGSVAVIKLGIKCTSCGHNTVDTATFCSKCGQKLK